MSDEEACSALDERDIDSCLKYRFLRRDLDADDLERPYVTTGPYCPWPQPNFGNVWAELHAA